MSTLRQVRRLIFDSPTPCPVCGGYERDYTGSCLSCLDHENDMAAEAIALYEEPTEDAHAT